MTRAEKKVIRRFQRVEKGVINELASYIGKAGKVKDPADWIIGRLYERGHTIDGIQAAIRKASSISKKDLSDIFEAAAKDASLCNSKLYKLSGKTPIPYQDNAGLQQVVRAIITQTAGTVDNFTKTTGFIIKDKAGNKKVLPLHQVFTDYLDDAALEVIYGYKDPYTAIEDCVNTLTASGLRTVDYASGRTDRIDTAVRRAIITGTNQITAHVQETDAALLGTDKFEVSFHSGARPSHQVWQGRVYSKTELTTICGLGTPGGLCGASCRHTYYPFIEGISKRSYTDKYIRDETARENTPVIYPPTGRTYTKYEATQYLRALELRMRVQDERVEALKAAGATQQAITAAESKYAIISSTYTHFAWTMELPEERERLLKNRRKKTP